MTRFFRAAGALLLIASVASSPFAQSVNKPKDLQWTHAFDLACRKFGEAEFTDATRRFGLEALKDLNTEAGLYLTEKGSIALALGFGGLNPPVVTKAPVWAAGLDLPARKAGEREFSKTTRVHCLEVFRDPHTDNYLFVTDQGFIAAGGGSGSGGTKTPEWSHSVDLNVRKGGAQDWQDAGKFGLEVYREPNTRSLIYICETGSIAIVADATAGKVEGKAPAWLHGLDLSIRKADEPIFAKGTRKFGVEVFRDETNGNLVYIAETGSIAVAVGGAKYAAPTADVKQPIWSHGWNIKARSYGEKEFTVRTKVFGGEVFRDDNHGAVIYLSETGTISVAKSR